MEFKWDEMIKSGIDFFKNGAGSVLGLTFPGCKKHRKWCHDILYRFCIFLLYSASERKAKHSGSQGNVRIYAKGLDRDFART